MKKQKIQTTKTVNPDKPQTPPIKGIDANRKTKKVVKKK